MKKAIRVLLVAVCLLMVFTTPVAAAAPYQTYTYSSTGFVLTSPDAYVPDQVVDGAIAAANFGDLRDMVVDENGYVYLVDATNACVQS